MAYKLISSIPTSAEVPQEQQGTSWLQTLGRLGAGTGLSALRGLEAIPSLIGQGLAAVSPELPPEIRNMTKEELEPYALQPISPVKLPSERITEAVGGSYFEPQNLPERFLYRFAERAPYAAFGGIPGLGLSAISTVGGQAAEELGLPEWAQAGAEMATGLGAQRALGKLPGLSKTISEKYGLGRAAAEGKKYRAYPAMKAAFNAETALASESDPAIVTRVKSAIDTVDRFIKSGEASPNKLLDVRKKLYQFRKKFPKESQHYIDTLTQGINSTFDGLIDKNPVFFKSIRDEADKLNSFKNMTTNIDKFADRMGDFVGSKFINDTVKKYAGPLTSGALKLVSAPFSWLEKHSVGIMKNRAAQDYFINMAKAAQKNDPSMFINNAAKLNKMIGSKEEHSQELIQTGRYRLID